MKKYLITNLLLLMALTHTNAENKKIDISGDNTSGSYKSYSTAFTLPKGDTANVKMARYCYFSSKITGSGTLNLYGGGERCYLGTEKGKAWPNWSGYTGDVHVWPFTENSSSAGSFGVLLAHGGKSSSPENAKDDAQSGKVNTSMANNRVTLHAGATITCEANTSGAGFRIGELDTEAGSVLSGYYKKSRSVYYMIGGANTNSTLAGTIKPTDYDDATLLSIVKEGTGTLTITGNNNYVSGGLRVLEGRVDIMNDLETTKNSKQRGALGAKPDAKDAIAYVFGNGVLGGTGSIGGTVDNYGTIEPGADGTGLLTLKNYAATKDANLTLHPASVLRFSVSSAADCSRLDVDGQLYITGTNTLYHLSEINSGSLYCQNAIVDGPTGQEYAVLKTTKMLVSYGEDFKANNNMYVDCNPDELYAYDGTTDYKRANNENDYQYTAAGWIVNNNVPNWSSEASAAISIPAGECTGAGYNPGDDGGDIPGEPAIWTYAFEDSYYCDYDMNDVVIKVCENENNENYIDVTLCCTGANYDLYVYLGKSALFTGKEVHRALGGTAGKFINTGDTSNEKFESKRETTVTIKKPSGFTFATADFWIQSPEGEIHVATNGQDPHGVVIPGDWAWPQEWVCVKEAYPDFVGFAADSQHQTNIDWYKNPDNDKTY